MGQKRWGLLRLAGIQVGESDTAGHGHDVTTYSDSVLHGSGIGRVALREGAGSASMRMV